MLRITHRTHNSRRIALQVEGRIVAEWVPVLRQEIVAALQAGGSVELDLARVSYVDNAGIEMLHRVSSERFASCTLRRSSRHS